MPDLLFGQPDDGVIQMGYVVPNLAEAMARWTADLGVGPVAMQQTLSIYLGAFTVMSLLHGPLSDSYGRRGVIFYALPT